MGARFIRRTTLYSAHNLWNRTSNNCQKHLCNAMKRYVHHHVYIGSMVKLVNTLDSKSSAARLLGSSPSTPTIFLRPSSRLSVHLKIEFFILYLFSNFVKNRKIRVFSIWKNSFWIRITVNFCYCCLFQRCLQICS